MMSCEYSLNDAYDLALRVGRGAARDYVAQRRDVAPDQQEELLGCFIIGLEEALTGVIQGRDETLSDIVEAAIEAFVEESHRLPAPALAADPERLFDFDSLIA